jgi:hypothetical protein
MVKLLMKEILKNLSFGMALGLTTLKVVISTEGNLRTVASTDKEGLSWNIKSISDSSNMVSIMVKAAWFPSRKILSTKVNMLMVRNMDSERSNIRMDAKLKVNLRMVSSERALWSTGEKILRQKANLMIKSKAR